MQILITNGDEIGGFYRMLIGIIVPVYNVSRYLMRCYESLKTQSCDNIEIDLIDDGSTDDSGTLCDLISSKDDRVLVVHKCNGGLSSARNAGIGLSKGDYIGFIDSDDYIEPDYFEVLAHDMEDFSADVAICGCKIVRGQSVKYRNGSGEFYEWDSDEALTELLHGEKLEPSACAKLYRNHLFETASFDETIRLSEDLPFNIKVFSQSSRITYRDVCPYVYEKRENSLTTSASFRRFASIIDTYDKAIESIDTENGSVRDAAVCRQVATMISVYNHSFDKAEADTGQIRTRIRKRLSEIRKVMLRSQYLPSRYKIASLAILTVKPVYDFLIMLKY